MANKNRSLALNLVALVMAMLLLVVASVPLYRMFCQATGYGGTTQQAAKNTAKIFSRTLTIRFNADTDPALPWDFAPGETEHKVKVGESALTYFVAHNRYNKPVTGRAMYNVVPFKAGMYFVKVQCFCFTQQTLAAGQKVHMPVSFYIDPAMLDDPEMNDVDTITLSYTFFINK